MTVRESSNLNSESFLTVGKDTQTSALQRSLIRFDFTPGSPVPSDCSVVSAKMYVYFENFETSGPRTLKVHQVATMNCISFVGLLFDAIMPVCMRI